MHEKQRASALLPQKVLRLKKNREWVICSHGGIDSRSRRLSERRWLCGLYWDAVHPLDG
jgi:hypothetical protein